ncbi:MAG: hypothetical protein C5S47_00965 [Candidatus Methanogasteraceae archaeon]|nr:MAG: hypothetical protein C5S47_00965 [ANME-2 cluster archaeon]
MRGGLCNSGIRTTADDDTSQYRVDIYMYQTRLHRFSRERLPSSFANLVKSLVFSPQLNTYNRKNKIKGDYSPDTSS